MESKNELKEIHIKSRTCYYFDDKTSDRNIYSDYILLGEKLYKTYENILIYDILYKHFMGAKPLCIRFDEIDRFIKIYDEIRYLVLSDYGWVNKICNRIKYLMGEKSGITDSINHNFGIIRINSYIFLPIKRAFTFHKVIILIKSVVNKNKNSYCYNIFL